MALSLDHYSLQLSRSWILCCFHTLVHVFGVIALYLAELVPGLKLALGVALLASFLFAMRGGLMLAPDSVVRLNYRDNAWRLTLANGTTAVATLRSPRVILHFIAALRFIDEAGRPYNVVVLPDSTDQETFRRTRMFLRLL